MVKNPPAMWENRFRSLGGEDRLEKGMATHSRILAWRILWTEEPGGLQSMRSQRVRHSWATFSYISLSTHFIYPFVFQKTVDCMTTMSVPSTLVKCLYLFFDLPHVPEAVGGAQNELPLAERRGLLQKVFVQVWKVLCVCSCRPPYFRCNRYTP